MCLWKKSCDVACMRRSRSINCFTFAAFEVFEDKCAQFIQCCKKSFPIVGLRKLGYKFLEVGIARDHKRCNWYLDFLTLRSEAHAPVKNFPVYAKAIFIISF